MDGNKERLETHIHSLVTGPGHGQRTKGCLIIRLLCSFLCRSAAVVLSSFCCPSASFCKAVVEVPHCLAELAWARHWGRKTGNTFPIDRSLWNVGRWFFKNGSQSGIVPSLTWRILWIFSSNCCPSRSTSKKSLRRHLCCLVVLWSAWWQLHYRVILCNCPLEWILSSIQSSALRILVWTLYSNYALIGPECITTLGYQCRSS